MTPFNELSRSVSMESLRLTEGLAFVRASAIYAGMLADKFVSQRYGNHAEFDFRAIQDLEVFRYVLIRSYPGLLDGNFLVPILPMRMLDGRSKLCVVTNSGDLHPIGEVGEDSISFSGNSLPDKDSAVHDFLPDRKANTISVSLDGSLTDNPRTQILRVDNTVIDDSELQVFTLSPDRRNLAAFVPVFQCAMDSFFAMR